MSSQQVIEIPSESIPYSEVHIVSVSRGSERITARQMNENLQNAINKFCSRNPGWVPIQIYGIDNTLNCLLGTSKVFVPKENGSQS